MTPEGPTTTWHGMAMSEPVTNPLEAILRHGSAAAPQPWYPSIYVRETGTPRDTLDPHLDRLRMGGLIQLTEWTQDKGQGYALTPEGEALLKDRRQLARLLDGQLPTRTAPVPQAGDDAYRDELPGESMRQALVGISQGHVTRALIYLNVAVLLAGLYLASREGAEQEYIANSTQEALYYTGALRGPLVFVKGQWWRLMTCCFVHIGAMHLVVNMISLHILGRMVEQMLGSARFLLLYLLSGFVGSCGMIIEHPLGGGAGASGAIWGIMAAELALVVAYRTVLPTPVYTRIKGQLVGMIILNVFITFSIQGISKGGHFGGGIAGLLLALPIDYLRVGRGAQRWLAAGAIVGVPVVALALVFRTFAQTPQLEPLAAKIEQADLDAEIASPLNETTRAAQQLYTDLTEGRQGHSALLSQNAKRREPAEVAQALKDIQGRREKSGQLAQLLKDHPPFKYSSAEKQRRAAIAYVEALDHLLELCADCLRAGPDCTIREQNRIGEQVEAVNEAHRKWQSLAEK